MRSVRGIGPARARIVIAVTAVILLIVDQWSKAVALARLDPLDPPSYLGGLLTLRLIRNPGAAFSLGEDFTLFFTGLAVVALQVVLVVLVPRVAVMSWSIVTGLLVAGIAGNLIDRLIREPGFLHGHVIDFFQVKYFGAIFNVADICLTTAAGLVILLSYVGRVDFDGTPRSAPSQPQPDLPAET